ncbi:MAG: lysophospholipid acyltransferase family protein [Acidobacteria bacterium]|nr:lysophospholipid acyltransferase family protein [Acidobacteriota bacterium]
MSPRRFSWLESLKLSLIPPLASIWIRLTRATMRIRRENFGPLNALSRSGKPCILAFWHGRMFLMPYSYMGTRVTILVSEHRDGEYISRTMARFGFTTARGSSTRSGAIGLREILRALKRGDDAAFTPDGPRGPRETVQPGVIAAARLSGAAIVPVTFACSKKNF